MRLFDLYIKLLKHNWIVDCCNRHKDSVDITIYAPELVRGNLPSTKFWIQTVQGDHTQVQIAAYYLSGNKECP